MNREITEMKISDNYKSEHDLYYKIISVYNVIEEWGLTETQINIIIYLIRHGFNTKTKQIICHNTGISPGSLNTNLSYLRQGRVGKKAIGRLLELSERNNNITLLHPRLLYIKELVESDCKRLVIEFNPIFNNLINENSHIPLG